MSAVVEATGLAAGLVAAFLAGAGLQYFGLFGFGHVMTPRKNWRHTLVCYMLIFACSALSTIAANYN